MNTCRVCKGHDEHTEAGRLVKYGVRHYAHAGCALQKWGASFFDRLTPWQAGHIFPALIANQFGLLGALRARAAQSKGQQ